MIKAGALSYVIVVSLIIASVLGSLISLSYFHRKSHIDLEIQNRLIRNANSGFNLLLSSPEISESQIDLFDQNTDSVLLKNTTWGLFDIGMSTAHHKSKSFSKTGLLGYQNNVNDNTALYLADLNRPLSLAGKTIINGDAFIPEAGIKRAYIERQNFVGNQLVNGLQKRSKRELPKLNDSHLNYINQQFLYNNEFDKIDSDSIINSFGLPTKHVFINSIIRGVFKGNVIIHSDKSIIVASDCVLEDVQIYAPEIVIESGFKGKAQFFASESIIVEGNVHLEYPSSISLIIEKENSLNGNSIIIESNSLINGIVLIEKQTNLKNQPKLILNNNSKIHGDVYVKGLSEIHGSILGTIYTEKFYLKTPSSIYENHLLNAEIDYFKRNKAFIGSNILEKSEQRKVIKWIN